MDCQGIPTLEQINVTAVPTGVPGEKQRNSTLFLSLNEEILPL